MASEPTYPLYLTRDQLWVLKEQLAAAADPEQRSSEEAGLLACIEWMYAQALKGEQVRPSLIRRLLKDPLTVTRNARAYPPSLKGTPPRDRDSLKRPGAQVIRDADAAWDELQLKVVPRKP